MRSWLHRLVSLRLLLFLVLDLLGFLAAAHEDHPSLDISCHMRPEKA